MKKVYAKVVADLMHPGHVQFFRRAKSLGDFLTVNVVSDDRVALAKRRPIMSTEERVQMVSACRYVDDVITDGPKVITREFMNARGFRIYAFGASGADELQIKLADCEDLPAEMKALVDYSTGISTTDIITRIMSRMDDERSHQSVRR